MEIAFAIPPSKFHTRTVRSALAVANIVPAPYIVNTHIRLDDANWKTDVHHEMTTQKKSTVSLTRRVKAHVQHWHIVGLPTTLDFTRLYIPVLKQEGSRDRH